MSSDSSEYLDLTAQVNLQAITGILCDSLHTPVSKICRLTHRLCVDLLLDPVFHSNKNKLHVCLQASDVLADYLIAEICASTSVRLEPFPGLEYLQLYRNPLQLAAISSISCIELSFIIGNAMFLYRYSEEGPFINQFFQGLGRAPYITNVCDAEGTVEQKSSVCILCTHIVLLPV